MSRWGVTIEYIESRYIEVEADSEDEAIEAANNRIDEAEPYGDDDYRFEAEELEDE